MKLNDKIRGAIVGYAFGDAIGLGTEFMTKNEVEAYYPGGLRHFSQIIRDAHRCQWERGEWTLDTELVTRFLECILDHGKFSLHALARNFKEWAETNNHESIPVYNMLEHNPEWLENPIQTTHKFWTQSGFSEATNDALHRSLVTALTSPREKLMEHTRRFVLMTHDDSRCVATAKIMAVLFHSLLTNEKEPTLDILRAICHENDARTLPFLQKAYDDDIESVGVDDDAYMTWTRVSMASALWAFWHNDNPADIIFSVVDLGGDADTNAALAGALAGLKYGYSELPEEVNNMPGLPYLLDLADRVTEFVRNRNDS